MRGALRYIWIELYIVGAITVPVTFQKHMVGLICAICTPAIPCCKTGAQALVLKPGHYLQHLERPQRKNLETYPAPGAVMFILMERMMRDTNYLKVINL